MSNHDQAPSSAVGHTHHDHEHGLGGTHTTDAPLKALLGALIITAVVFLAELIAGVVSGSLALLSDAMHMLSDATGLIIALLAMLIGRRKATDRSTFGHRRVEVVAALFNAVVVTLVVVWILIQAIGRLGSGTEIDTTLMISVAVIGLLANAASALILMGQRHASLNMRGAFLHVITDMLGSVAVIVAGVVIALTGWTAADTLASLAIVALVLPRSLKLLTDSLSVLLNRVPDGIDLQEVERELLEIPHVEDIHDLHVWSTEGVNNLATCHLVIDEGHDSRCGVLDEAQERLRTFGIEHSTIQLEHRDHASHEVVCD
ncbi:cation diffusion facilitator family transporter [Corynebacterium maris]|uniref:cation diffusion facilitator family transporter n=1 Tax=Corynebacterium maris TaxID=575200 RepID=UPI00059EF32F|nr:cation diffusion facilitator family transporter [Corynebacterium maris]